MSPIDPHTRENVEAAMVHAKAAAKARGETFCGPKCMFLDSCARANRCVTAGTCEYTSNPHAAFFDLPMNQGAIPVGTPINVLPRTDKPEPGTLSGFDSEAYRSFMRSLG